jgi:phosphoribosylformylglycinamidine cyclo-ligase
MSEAYRRAGVDLEAGAKAVELIRGLSREVAEAVGGFAGEFDLGDGRSLVAATDGVGTKLEVARLAGRLDTIGIDLVAMCVDDVVCTGARPLFLLDYLATARVVPEEVASIVAGVVEGCGRAGCVLLGGETAEHPGVLEDGRFDLAGFCVGVVDERDRIGPHRVVEGDALVGLPSTGLHSNGYSLVRSALLGRGAASLEDRPPGLRRTLGEDLLEPTAIYAPLVLELAAAGLVHAAAHVTGGGIPENLPRALPDGLGAEVDERTWDAPPIFELVRRAANASASDMRSTFNMGVGMVLVVRADDAADVVGRSAGASTIGRVVAGAGVRYITEG